jgi:hypothetical protein
LNRSYILIARKASSRHSSSFFALTMTRQISLFRRRAEHTSRLFYWDYSEYLREEIDLCVPRFLLIWLRSGATDRMYAMNVTLFSAVFCIHPRNRLSLLSFSPPRFHSKITRWPGTEVTTEFVDLPLRLPLREQGLLGSIPCPGWVACHILMGSSSPEPSSLCF